MMMKPTPKDIQVRYTSHIRKKLDYGDWEVVLLKDHKQAISETKLQTLEKAFEEIEKHWTGSEKFLDISYEEFQEIKNKLLKGEKE